MVEGSSQRNGAPNSVARDHNTGPFIAVHTGSLFFSHRISIRYPGLTRFIMALNLALPTPVPFLSAVCQVPMSAPPLSSTESKRAPARPSTTLNDMSALASYAPSRISTRMSARQSAFTSLTCLCTAGTGASISKRGPALVIGRCFLSF